MLDMYYNEYLNKYSYIHLRKGKGMFIEISDIKKHFGEGESRVEVLKGINLEIEKARYVFCSVLPVQESQHFSILLAELIHQTVVTFQ